MASTMSHTDQIPQYQPPRRNRRGRALLFAAIALIILAAGVGISLNLLGSDSTDNGSGKTLTEALPAAAASTTAPTFGPSLNSTPLTTTPQTVPAGFMQPVPEPCVIKDATVTCYLMQSLTEQADPNVTQPNLQRFGQFTFNLKTKEYAVDVDKNQLTMNPSADKRTVKATGTFTPNSDYAEVPDLGGLVSAKTMICNIYVDFPILDCTVRVSASQKLNVTVDQSSERLASTISVDGDIHMAGQVNAKGATASAFDLAA